MKRLLIIFMAAMFLVACGADNEYEKQRKEAEKQLEESEAELERVKEVSKQIDETSDLIGEVQEEMGIEDDSVDVDELDESEAIDLLEYEALGEGDTLTDIVVENGEIKAVIEMADADSIFAEVIYSSAGDALLEHEGWDVLTIDFIDVGEISMNRNEKETNEYGMDHFPLEKIIGKLRNE